MTTERHSVDNGEGFRLSLRRTLADPPRLGRPLLIVPGYGMNSFIFSFHPHGPSLEAVLASRGIDVWTVDLRCQGDTVNVSNPDPHRYGLHELAGVDLTAALRYVAETVPGRIDVLGASLGASIVFAHLALYPESRVERIVTLGGLVTWVKVPPLVAALFASPRVMGLLPFRGTRKLAGFALPTLARVAPGFLSIYLHTQSTDIENAKTMVRTVEDPNRHVNREIAEWIRKKELVVAGVNVSRALPGMTYPFLCVVAMQDGIVPPETARALFDTIGSKRKELLEIGSKENPIAHADLFLATGAQEAVFGKIADFLLQTP